jgi:transcriptional regulator with GAF, ATPase, and Fis domain
VKAIPLTRLLDRDEIAPLLEAFSSLLPPVGPTGITDADGEWLVAHPAAPVDSSLVQRVRETRSEAADERALALPLVVEGRLYGVLQGDRSTASLLRALHQVLRALIGRELLHKALAKETLDRYREINLLYRVHQVIGTSLDLQEVVRRVLGESIHIIKASGGSVLLSDNSNGRLVACDSFGLDVAQAERALIGGALSENVLETGRPRILNDLNRYLRPDDVDGVQLVALLCAPLRASETVLGVIILAQTQLGEMFTAADEKLLSALASQAGLAIAKAIEVEARERRLREQIDALRIEIDEAQKQREVFAITESEFFEHLERNAQMMRAEFDM